MENKLACCFLTHNHPAVVREVLDACCRLYDEKGIDIYIYDSSKSSQTEEIVRNIIANGAENLYYVDMRFTRTGDEKVVRMLQGYGFQKHYDYIWNSKDRCYFVGDALNRIVEAAERNEYDVIMAVDEETRWEMFWPPLQDEYEDAALFYSHYGQLATNWECLMRKTETMVDPLDMEFFQMQYGLGADNPFNQGVSLFARLAELDRCKIKIVRSVYDDKMYCTQVGSGWIAHCFEVWIDKWIAANFSLPSVYDPYKMAIIKSQTAQMGLFGSTDTFLILKENGILTYDIYKKYLQEWPLLTDLPVAYIERIATGHFDQMYQMVVEDFLACFEKQEFDKAHAMFYSNRWLKSVFEKEIYETLDLCFRVYKSERREKGVSALFYGITSLQGLLEKMDMLRKVKDSM